MKIKSHSRKSQTLIRLLLIFGILAVINVIAVRLFTRIDLTSQGLYSLSDASKKLVGSFDDRVTVKAYFTEDLPAPYNNNRRTVLDILNEYRAYSKGNLQYEFINPAGEKGEQEARQAGIPPVEVQVVNKDKFEVKRAYLGLIMSYEDRKEVLPVIQNLGSLEYDLSSAMKRLTTKEKKTIGFASGFGESEINSLQSLNRALSGQYSVVSVDMKAGIPVGSNIAVLAIAGTKQVWSDTAKFFLDQYIMRGGKTAFFANRINASLRSQYGQPMELGYEPLLEQYGLRINADAVRDIQCANVTMMQQQQGFSFQSQVPFPLLPMVSNFNKENAIVKDLQSVVLEFPSSVDTNLAASKGISVTVLARSSKQSGRENGFFVIDPMRQYTEADFSEKGVALAVLAEGSFKSYYSVKPPPPGLTPSGTSSPQTQIVVIGDADFMTDDFARNASNLNLAVNTIDYLADDAGLITIRTKNPSMPPLDQVSNGTKAFLKYGNLLLPPLGVVAYGLLRWRMRRAKKNAM